MAKQPDEQNIKSRARRRLIGAIALALVVVVVLPMVLDSEPKITGQDIDLRIPASDKVGEFVPGVAISEVAEADTLPESAVVVASEVPAPVLANAVPAASGKITLAEVKPEVSQQAVTSKPPEARPTEAKKIAEKPAEAKPVETATITYVVQVGAFSNSGTATQEAEKLKGWGFKAYTEFISGTTRVRVGPYVDRSKADEVRTLLEKHGLHPVVSVVK